MNEELIIRHVAQKDFNCWKELWDGYNTFYGRSGETALSTEIVKITWSRFFDVYEPVYALVAERAGRLLGLAHYLFHRSTIQIIPNCYLQDLFTLEEARGQGVGRALINKIYEIAKNAGIKKVYWQTQETNFTAMRLYDKVANKSGFVVYSKSIA